MARRAKKPLSPRKEPRQERSRETVATILEGAARVLGERGYWDTTTNHVASAAGVSVGTLYEYFPNKEALVAALIHDHLRVTRTLLDGIAADVAKRTEWDPVEVVVRRFVDALTALHERDPDLHRVLFEQVPLAPELRDATEQVERDLVQLAADILRQHPDIRVDDPEMIGAIVVYAMEALTHKLVIHPTPGMDHQAYRRAVTSMIAGFVAPSG